MKHLGNVCEINGSEVEPVDIITFGSPCQDMSIAGKREGIKHSEHGDEETTRSGLFYEAIRIIKEMREATHGEYPKYAVWENVPGAFSSNKGWDFLAVLEALCSVCDSTVSIPEPHDKKRPDKLVWDGAGEIVGNNFSICWRTLDAQFWGVPQRRKRIYLVADFNTRCAREILFKPDSLRGNLPQGDDEGEKVTADAMGSTDGSIRAAGFSGKASKGAGSIGFERECSATLRAGQEMHCVIECLNPWDCQSKRIFSPSGIYPTLPAMDCGGANNQAVIALQGNGIDRADTAGCNGCGWRKNEMYTLNTVDRPAVCYQEIVGTLQARDYKGVGNQYVGEDKLVVECCDARGNGDGETVSTITGDHESRITDYTALALYTRQRSDEFSECGLASCESARQYKDATDLVVQGTLCFNEGQITSPANGNNPQWNQPCHTLSATDSRAPTVIIKPKPPRKYIIRRLMPVECARLQGFPDRWGQLAPFNPDDAGFWENVRKTYAEINGKKYKPTKNLKKWYDKLHNDGAEYKMWGNGIALPCAEYVLHGIAEHGAKTLGSLFDGSGGFPLAGAINGIIPLWSSEVEPYPIAVTKSRFPEIAGEFS